jgi:proteasome lid subunit RPN8/RPN11
LIVAEAVAEETGRLLREFRAPGLRGRRHEGLVLWLGVKEEDDTVIVAVAAPNVSHGPARVEIDRHEVGLASKAARASGLSLLAQVHSHPGGDTRHSDGDDEMILLPHEGAYSLVVGRYGQQRIEARPTLGLHQYQDGRWVLARPVSGSFILAPTLIR